MSKPRISAAESARACVSMLAGAWLEFRSANMTDQAAAAERALSDVVRSLFLGRVFGWDRETAFIVRPETPDGRVELLELTPLD